MHQQFIPTSQTVVPEVYYIAVIKRLREAVRQKRNALWKETTALYDKVVLQSNKKYTLKVNVLTPLNRFKKINNLMTIANISYK